MSNTLNIQQSTLLAAAINGQSILKYLSVIGPTILAYDWCLTLDSEITHVWSRRWGVIEYLYLFSRYMPFADTTIMLMYHFFLVDPSTEACHAATTAQCWMYVVGMGMSEQIFMIRTWAVCGRSQAIGLALFIQAALAAIVEIYSTFRYINSLTYFQGYNPGGCLISNSSNIIFLAYAVLLFTESTYLVLVLLKTYPTARRDKTISLLSNVILQDGVLFFITLFVLLLLDIILAPSLGILSTILTRICHSIFASRIILHIREADKRRTKDDAFMSTLMTI